MSFEIENENQTLDKVIDQDVSNQTTKENKEIKGSIYQIKPENEINVNEDTISDVDENTEASNVAHVEQSQIELSSDDINLCPESFPSSTDSTKNYAESDKLPKIKKKVRYLPKDNSTNWKTATIISRAGKSTGKYKNFFNLCNDDGNVTYIDWENDVIKWHHVDDESDMPNSLDEALVAKHGFSDADVQQAKFEELENWRRNKVYEEVPFNHQKYISTNKWVIIEKAVEGEKKLKALLVVRGFEEQAKIQTDSPTCSKECQRLVLTLMASREWQCNSIDILQGKPIDRDVYVKRSMEVFTDGTIWKFKTCVYGLNDASRTWYMRVREELIKLGAKVSNLMQVYFTGTMMTSLKGSCPPMLMIFVGEEQVILSRMLSIV